MQEQEKGKGIREAVKIALEAMPGRPIDNVVESEEVAREHSVWFVMGFAKCRGVILSRHDITEEFDRIAAEIKERGL